MSNHSETLKPHLVAAYGARVMGQGTAPLYQLAQTMAEDPSLRAHVEAEVSRLNAVRDRCFASRISADFLNEALAHPVPTAATKALQAMPILMTPTKEDEMTSKLKGLADIAKSTIADVENRASAAMDKLTKAQAHAHSGLDKVDGVTAEIEKAATDMEDFANQVSNGPPA